MYKEIKCRPFSENVKHMHLHSTVIAKSLKEYDLNIL